MTMSPPLEVIYTPEIFSIQPVGGISRYFVELIRHLRAAGQSPRIAAGVHINRYLRDVPGVAGAYFPFAAGRIPRLRQAFNRAVCRAELARHPQALVHQTYFGETAHLKGRRVVVTVYDLIHELFKDAFADLRNPGDPTSRYQRAACERADRVIAISAATKADLVRLFGLDPGKITVIHLGDSLRQIPVDEALAEAIADPGDEYLLHVGSRVGYKNFAALRDAFARSADLRRRFRLVCFGGGAFSDEERRGFRDAGLEDRIVHQSGDDEALARCYRGAAAFVCPSLYEGFGLPVLEAMGQGCPVLCARAGSLPEVAGEAAAYFDPREIESLRATLAESLADVGRLAQLRAAGRARARLFSWEKCARETLEVYRRLDLAPS